MGRYAPVAEHPSSVAPNVSIAGKPAAERGRSLPSEIRYQKSSPRAAAESSRLTVAQSISAIIFGRGESGAGAHIRRGCAQRDAMTPDPGFVAPVQPVAPRRPKTKRARSRSIIPGLELSGKVTNL